MEKMIKVERKNVEGKIISKEVPENLLSLYLNGGWYLHKKNTNSKYTAFVSKSELNSNEKDI